jgi:signal transduction histidine kinase
MNLHNGDINVYSIQGCGTTITLDFPIKNVDNIKNRNEVSVE